MQKYKKLGKLRAKVADVCMVSMTRHSWYLDPSLVVMALADPDVPVNERQKMAKCLAKLKQPEDFKMGKPKLEALKMGRKPPTLASLVKAKSWLMFSMLNMTEEELGWLTKDVIYWSKDPGFLKFRDFVNNLTVVNDPAERSVKLVQEFVNTCQDEELRQDLLLSMAENRKVNKVGKKSDLAVIGNK